MVAGAASVKDNPRINLAQPAQRLHYSGPGVQGPASDCDSDSSESVTQSQSRPRNALPLPTAADADSSARWIVPATQFHLPAWLLTKQPYLCTHYVKAFSLLLSCAYIYSSFLYARSPRN